MQYDTERINKTSIVGWLDKQGYKKQRGSGKYVSYFSPFGQENNASFKVNTAKNTWTCYHSGKGGDIIKLVQEIEGCSFQQACSILSGGDNVHIQQHTPQKSVSGVKIHSVEELTDPELLDYIIGVRRINRDVVMHYCRQIQFSFPYSKKDASRTYTGVGFQTGKESWEVRNSWMKICAGSKSIKTIRGTDENPNECLLFEAWIDAMSYLTLEGVVQPKLKMHILNGAGLINVLSPMLENKTVYAYVDNDNAGSEIISKMDKSNVIDMRYSFLFYNDMNEYLQNL